MKAEQERLKKEAEREKQRVKTSVQGGWGAAFPTNSVKGIGLRERDGMRKITGFSPCKVTVVSVQPSGHSLLSC